ncbi:MAG: hypothetical protein N3D20_01755 [Candidatus Pacearchaeota archaeon]|nr:hypothetical protein [Candidatus Pacearchaeota archaeon]
MTTKIQTNLVGEELDRRNYRKLTDEMKNAIREEIIRLLKNGTYCGIRWLEKECNKGGYEYQRTTLTYHISEFIERCVLEGNNKKAKEIIEYFRDFGYSESWLRKL